MTFGNKKHRRLSRKPEEEGEGEIERESPVEDPAKLKDSGELNKRASSEINTADLLTNHGL